MSAYEPKRTSAGPFLVQVERYDACSLSLRGSNKAMRFIRLVVRLSGSVSVCGRAQQPDRMRRVGVLIPTAEDDQDNKVRIAAFQRLQQLGWTDGHNVRIDYRFVAGNPENYPKYAAELVALAPDVILAPGSSLAPMLQATRTVPIVFPFAADPVGSASSRVCLDPAATRPALSVRIRFVRKMAGTAQRDRAGRNASGSPSGSHRNHRDRPIRRHPVRGTVGRRGREPAQPARAGEIERAVTAFARSNNGGLIVAASALASVQRNLIVELAAATDCPRSTSIACSSLAAV